jgi:hypothetical protein
MFPPLGGNYFRFRPLGCLLLGFRSLLIRLRTGRLRFLVLVLLGMPTI